MTKPRKKKGVTQQGKTESPKQQQICDQQDEQRRPADGDKSAGPLSLTGPSESSSQHTQQQAVCHSDVLIKSISVTEGQKQPFTLTSTPKIQQDIRQSLAIFRSKSLSSLDSDDSNRTLTTLLSGLSTPARSITKEINTATPSSVKRSGAARRQRRKLDRSSSSTVTNEELLDTTIESLMDADISPKLSNKHMSCPNPMSSTPKRTITDDNETPMSLTKRPRSDQNTVTHSVTDKSGGAIPKTTYLENLKVGLHQNYGQGQMSAGHNNQDSTPSAIKPPSFVAYIDTTNGVALTQEMSIHIRDNLVKSLYDPPGFSSAPARFLQYGLVVNPLTQTPIFKITCADSKSVDWVISAGNSLPRFGFNAFKALRWNQLPKPISLFSFFPRKKEGDAETIKHNLARSNPAINIRRWTTYKTWPKEKGLLICFGVDPASHRYIQMNGMRLFFELSTVEFRPSNKDQPQSNSTETKAGETGTTNVDTGTNASGTVSETARLLPRQPQHNRPKTSLSGTAQLTDTTAGTAKADTGSGTAGKADTTIPSLMSLNLSGTTRATDTITGTAVADTIDGTVGRVVPDHRLLQDRGSGQEGAVGWTAPSDPKRLS